MFSPAFLDLTDLLSCLILELTTMAVWLLTRLSSRDPDTRKANIASRMVRRRRLASSQYGLPYAFRRALMEQDEEWLTGRPLSDGSVLGTQTIRVTNLAS